MTTLRGAELPLGMVMSVLYAHPGHYQILVPPPALRVARPPRSARTPMRQPAPPASTAKAQRISINPVCLVGREESIKVAHPLHLHR